MSVPRALAVAAKSRAKIAGIDVVYRIGSVELPLRVVPGSTAYDEYSDEAAVLRRQTRDYLIETVLLVVEGVPFLPERGHLIEECVGCQTLQYEVIPIDGQNVFRYTDPYRVGVRIHTQQVS